MHTLFKPTTALAFMTILVTSALCTTPSHAQLIHSYDFTSGVTDAVGSANGTLLDGAIVNNGFLQLNGTTSYVQFGEKIVPTSGSYSVTLFAFQNVSQAGQHIEFISQGSSGGPGFYIGYDPSNQIRVTDSWTGTGVLAPAVGQWNHFALTVDTVQNRSFLYVNGLLQATRELAISTTPLNTDTRLGRQFGGFAEFFNGSLDDVRIYQNTLSGADVANLAANRSVAAAAAPEPGTLLLLVSGALMGAGALRRRKATGH